MAHWDGSTCYDADLSHGRRTVDIQTHTVTWGYPWGTASCRYTLQGNSLGMLIKVTNTAAYPLHSLTQDQIII